MIKKFSGSGTLAFKQLEKYYKKNKKVEKEQNQKNRKEVEIKCKNLAEQLIKEYFNPKKQKENYEIKKRLETKKIFSLWERKVINKLTENKIKFEEKFRIFPIKINNDLSIKYEPDFLLEEYEINNKEIIIEAHEKLTEDDVVKYSIFMKRYFTVFHLIMIVKDNDLRGWNEISKSSRLFNDIWIMDNLKDLIDWIKRQHTKKQDFKEQSTCPHCPTIAIGTKQIYKLFGFRKKKNGEKFTQSLCRECRGLQLKLGTEGLKDFRKMPKPELLTEDRRFCTGCNNYFKTKIPDQTHCIECNKKYWEHKDQIK